MKMRKCGKIISKYFALLLSYISSLLADSKSKRSKTILWKTNAQFRNIILPSASYCGISRTI